MSRLGFSLAEVLITFGIIGVIAAITIPSLFTKISEFQNIAKLKVSYSILTNSLKLAQQAGDDWTTWEYYHNPTCTKDIYNTLSKYMKVSQNCGTADGCWQQTKVKSNKNALYANPNGLFEESYSFILLNGISFCFDIWRGYNISDVAGVSTNNLINPDAVLVIAVDVNGKQSPNTLGKDVFLFVLTANGIIPSGADNKGIHCDDKSTNNNWDCTSKALGS